MKPRALAFAFLAALAAFPMAPANIGAQVAAKGEGYTFRVKYVAGEVTEFVGNTVVTITGGPEGMPGPTEVDVELTQEVVSVENGVATLKMVTKTLTAGPDGKIADPTTQTIRVNELGQTVDENGKLTTDGSGVTAALPTEPVKVGGTWTTELDAPGGTGKIKTASTFVGLEKDEDTPVAKVEFTLAMDGKAATDGSGTLLLDASNGQLVRMSMKTDTKMTVPGVDGPMTVSMTLTLKRA